MLHWPQIWKDTLVIDILNKDIQIPCPWTSLALKKNLLLGCKLRPHEQRPFNSVSLLVCIYQFCPAELVNWHTRVCQCRIELAYTCLPMPPGGDQSINFPLFYHVSKTKVSLWLQTIFDLWPNVVWYCTFIPLMLNMVFVVDIPILSSNYRLLKFRSGEGKYSPLHEFTISSKSTEFTQENNGLPRWYAF